MGDKNGYNLVYRPLSVTTIEGVPTITQTETTSREVCSNNLPQKMKTTYIPICYFFAVVVYTQIYIPALDERLNLPDDQYLLQVPRGSGKC